jgi:hypothetical protein
MRAPGALLALMAFVVPVVGQTQDVGETIEAAADALGMVRTVARRMDSINAVQFSATGGMRVPQPGGEWTSHDLTNLKVGMSYYIPAMRWDMTRTEADGSEQRSIQVVREDRTWDEEEPGVNPMPVTGRAAERLRQIWLTPHGIIRAAVDAEAANPGSVTVGSEDGRTTLSVTVDGTPMTAVLDADNRPERVTMMIDHPVLGRTPLTAHYSGYLDWQILDVYFPSRIVQTLGDETTLDLTITEFYQNPYVVFPTPEQLARSSQ